MKKEFRATLEDNDSEDLLIPYLQADAREYFLFELFNNFFRQWKHVDGMVDIEDVKEKLFKLKNEYNIILRD